MELIDSFGDDICVSLLTKPTCGSKVHSTQGLKQKRWIVSQFDGCDSEIKVWAGLVPSEAKGEPVSGLVPQFVDGHLLPVSANRLPSMRVCVSTFLLDKDSGYLVLRSP